MRPCCLHPAVPGAETYHEIPAVVPPSASETQTLPLPLVYLPGAGGRASVWSSIAERLARRRRPILLDYPGLGAEPLDASIGSVADLRRWVSARLPGECDLAALSMGCSLALALALEEPARIRRLVLVAAAGGVDVRRFGAVEWRDAFVARRPDAPRWFVDDRTDLSEKLTSVSTPTLLVFGENDLVAPVAVGKFLSERLPNARLEIVPGATHDLEAEEPDWIASAIEAHLRK